MTFRDAKLLSASQNWQTRPATQGAAAAQNTVVIIARNLKTFIRLLIASGCCGVSTSAWAQVPVPIPVRFDTKIVVTSERGETPRAQVPAATVVIDKATLAALPVVHPSEILTFIPGFNIMQGQFHAGRPVISARGFFGGGEAEYVLMLVDGLPVGDVESGLIDLSLIPTSSIRRIEAHRGPGASTYGDAAVGGVIQILTERAENAGQFSLTGGTFGSITADGSYGRGAHGWGLTLSGAARHTDGAYRHSRAGQYVAAGSVERAIDGVNLRLTLNGYRRKHEDPGSAAVEAVRTAPRTLDPAFDLDRLDRRNLSMAFALRAASSAWSSGARFFVKRRAEDLIRTILFLPGFGDTRARTLSSLSVGGSVESERTLSVTRRHLVRFGGDVAHERLDTRYNEVSPAGDVGAFNSRARGRRIRAGIFAAASFEATPRVHLTGAIRWDGVDDAGFGAVTPSKKAAWSPRAGIVVQLSDPGGVVLFAQVARAFKVPTLDQMFDPRPYPDFRGGTFSISNSTLTPQRATNLEAGISGSGPLRWSALAYQMTVEGEIDFDARTFSYANVGRSRHIGAEIEIEGNWWKRVRPTMSYAWTRVTDRSSRDRDTQLKNIPERLMSVGVSVDFPWRVGTFVYFKHSGGAFFDGANVLSIKGPSTLDLRIRRPIGRTLVVVDVINATNSRYEEYGYTLTDFVGGVVPYAYPGARRTIRVGLTVSF
ncbi:MAG: TonB-dependent receptor [Acidobacteria bacterium]|nr:TonB-dependent receptor [Acidobacteriota bacterium]